MLITTSSILCLLFFAFLYIKDYGFEDSTKQLDKWCSHTFYVIIISSTTFMLGTFCNDEDLIYKYSDCVKELNEIKQDSTLKTKQQSNE